MYAFFYSLYLSLFLGEWTTKTTAEAKTALGSTWEDLTTWIMNTLGGDFTTAQSFTWQTAPETIWALIMALITMTGLSFLVWKLTKLVFSIFFGGWRR